MAGNKALNAAAKAKQDEFYTQLTDIENELKHYRSHFKNKVVLCNCDDPFESNFFKYFVLNFNRLDLKQLIATSYATSPIAGTQFNYHIDKNGQMSFTFGGNKNNAPLKKAYKAVVNAVYDKTGNKYVEMEDVAELFKSGENVLTELEGDGDFRSEECIGILKEADVVCTNPPFSLFREYVAQLIEYDKKFLIIGNQNNVSYKDFFPLLKDNKIWLGYHSGHTLFAVPDTYDVPDFYDPDDKQKMRSNGYVFDENGKLWRNLGNICWYTNMDIKKRHEDLILIKRYDPKDYPKYDNYDAVEVSMVVDIPYDYAGVMGVPITFLDKYCPEQFEIIGISGELAGPLSLDGKVKQHPGRFYVNGKRLYDRIAIRNKNPRKAKEI